MVATLLAFTQDERIAIIGALAVVLAAAIPGIVSAVTAHKTKQVAIRQAAENTEQHGESQRKLAELTKAVHSTGGKVDALSDRVDTLDQKHDRLVERFGTHEGMDLRSR
jgi:peptidoglycan hydrolase CwlO-like protein